MDKPVDNYQNMYIIVYTKPNKPVDKPNNSRYSDALKPNKLRYSNTLCYTEVMPKVLCFDCGYMYEIAYGTPNPTKQCPKCRGTKESLWD